MYAQCMVSFASLFFRKVCCRMWLSVFMSKYGCFERYFNTYMVQGL